MSLCGHFRRISSLLFRVLGPLFNIVSFSRLHTPHRPFGCTFLLFPTILQLIGGVGLSPFSQTNAESEVSLHLWLSLNDDI